MIAGYARVLTIHQGVGAHVGQRAADACRMFRETASGAQTDRRPHSTRELLNAVTVVACRKAVSRSPGDASAGTANPCGRPMRTALGYLAEFERELVRARTTEGCRRAVARGVKHVPKPTPTPHQIKEAIGRRDAGQPVREIARSYKVSPSTISRLKA